MLEHSLSLHDLTLFGVASIMGSGGFYLIGNGVRSGGSMWPIALGIASILIIGSAYSYAGAYERSNKNTSETDIIQSVLGPVASHIGIGAVLLYSLASIVVILVLCSHMIAPTASRGAQTVLSIALLATLSYLAILGIDVDKSMINSTTGVLLATLAAAVVIGGVGLVTLPMPPALRMPNGSDFMRSLWMFFYVLVGFDAIMKFAEESADVSNIPNAMYASNLISILFTAGIAGAITMWLPTLTATTETTAFEHLFAKALGPWITEPFKWLIVAFLLLTVFVVFLATTRYLYGLGGLSEWLAPLRVVNPMQAPWVAILTIFGAGSVLALANDLTLLVMITDLGFASIAALVAGSVSVADWNEGHMGSAAVNGLTTAGFLGLLGSAFL